MKKFPNRVTGAKRIAGNVQPKMLTTSTGTITVTENNELFENQRRATVIGPVLDEILHASWNHWGMDHP